jgi:hypothetical protein
MRPRSVVRRRALIAVALLALACLAGALVDESFIHTDDGCAFETHCVACLLSAASVVVASVAVSAPIVLERVAVLSPSPAFAVHEADVRIEVSRGPPSRS